MKELINRQVISNQSDPKKKKKKKHKKERAQDDQAVEILKEPQGRQEDNIQ